MLGSLRNLFGITVTENEETIIVSGFNARDMGSFINRYWNTSVLEKYMFKSLTVNKMEFYKFFLIDVIYMFETLIKNPGKLRYLPIRTLKDVVDKLKSNTWYKDVDGGENYYTNRLDFNRLNLFNYPPKPFQQGFLDYYNKTPDRYKLNGALLNGSAGSGKTVTNLYTMTLANMERIIVVCPKNALQRVWFDDAMKHFKNPPKIWHSGMLTEPDKDTYLFIYHYEALEKAFFHHSNDWSNYRYGLILDESHNLNDVKAQRTQLWLRLVKESQSRNIIHASGTPFKAMGSESIPLLRAIDPMFTPKAEEAFKKIFGHSAQKGMDILKNRLGLISYIIKKEELGLEKPEMILTGVKIPDGKKYTLAAIKVEMQKFISERLEYYNSRQEEDMAFWMSCLERHELSLTSKEMGAYKEYLRCLKVIQRQNGDIRYIPDEVSYCKKYERERIEPTLLDMRMIKQFREIAPIIKYLTLKIQGECLGRVVGKARIDAHVAMCRYIPFREICQSTLKKTVVFTSFVDVLETAYNTCREQDLNPILVYGKTNKDLASLVSRFEKEKELNPLIATYDSLSTAVPLTMADTMILINSPYRTYILEQAISRIHRLNQDSQTRIHQLYLDTGNEKNISERSLDIMKWSQEQVEAITGVKSPYEIKDEVDSKITIGVENLDELDHIFLSMESPTVVELLNEKDKPSRSRW